MPTDGTDVKVRLGFVDFFDADISRNGKVWQYVVCLCVFRYTQWDLTMPMLKQGSLQPLMARLSGTVRARRCGIQSSSMPERSLLLGKCVLHSRYICLENNKCNQENHKKCFYDCLLSWLAGKISTSRPNMEEYAFPCLQWGQYSCHAPCGNRRC